jgi:hypothetical protein
MVGFVDCIEKVDGYDGDIDAPVGFRIPRRVRRRNRVAGASYKAVIEAQDPATGKLGLC